MNKNTQQQPDIEAEVTYLTTEAGGRKSPVFSGHRPQHSIIDDYLTSGHHEYLNKTRVELGETVLANIWFITPEIYPHTLWIGREIRVQEASHLIGFAKVTKIFNKLLEKKIDKIT